MHRSSITYTLYSAGVLLSLYTAHAVTLDFEGVSPPGSLVFVGQSYIENGYELFNPGGPNDALVVGQPHFNTSGSDYYSWNRDPVNNPVILTALSGDPFNLHSLDVGSLFGGSSSSVFSITGHLVGGGTLVVGGAASSFINLALNWANLASVDFTYLGGDFGAIDNLVITSTVISTPDPASTLMLLGGGLMAIAGMRRKLSRI